MENGMGVTDLVIEYLCINLQNRKMNKFEN
jgi:hypothetical protein